MNLSNIVYTLNHSGRKRKRRWVGGVNRSRLTQIVGAIDQIHRSDSNRNRSRKIGTIFIYIYTYITYIIGKTSEQHRPDSHD